MTTILPRSISSRRFAFKLPPRQIRPLSTPGFSSLVCATRSQPRPNIQQTRVRNYSATSPASPQSPKMPPSNSSAEKKRTPAIPRPSSSVVLVSPKNEVLLLHRVQTSSSFASAHVFPGGNLSGQDGTCPPAEDFAHHDDAPPYRRAAIRELFEESGILLAKDSSSGKMLVVDEATREAGRRLIHQNQTTFDAWLKQQNPNAIPDIDQLIPFTHWITPTNVPKRYTTQMYLYFMPLPVNLDKSLLDKLPKEGEREEIQVPTSDGGVEVTEAQFLPASEWLDRSQKGNVILFPPQYLLLHLVSGFLDKSPQSGASIEELEERRAALVEFVHTGSPPWTDMYISPKMLKMTEDGRTVLALNEPGPELKGSGRQGESDRVVVVRFKKGSVGQVSVGWKKDVMSEGRENSSHL